jgi:hypothetical protein
LALRASPEINAGPWKRIFLQSIAIDFRNIDNSCTIEILEKCQFITFNIDQKFHSDYDVDHYPSTVLKQT